MRSTLRAITFRAGLLALAASSAVAAGPPRALVDPAGGGEDALRAPRFLAELHQAGSKEGGVRLSGDVDGDGDVDLLQLRRRNSDLLPIGVRTYLNQGRAKFQLAHELQLLVSADSNGFFDIARNIFLADVTGDGVLDLVYDRKDVTLHVTPPNDGVTVREQLAGGVFAAPFVLDVPGPTGPVGQMDANRDGRLDLVCGRQEEVIYSSLQLLSAWIRGPGPGGFQERRDWIVRDAAKAFGDVDGDGDVDAVSNYLVENKEFEGPRAGSSVQYGLEAATAGTGGVHPVLGARGPFRPDAGAALAISRGLGRAAGYLLMGRSRADVTQNGVEILVAPQHLFAPVVLGGASGVAGAGSALVPLPSLWPLIGRTFTFQAILTDPGSSVGLSATNGLEMRFGSSLPFAER